MLVGFVAAILLVPFTAMQVSSEINWAASDFVIAGVMLFTFGAALQVVFADIKDKTNKIIVAGLIIVLFLLTWAELAVGIFGTPWAGS